MQPGDLTFASGEGGTTKMQPQESAEPMRSYVFATVLLTCGLCEFERFLQSRSSKAVTTVQKLLEAARSLDRL